MPEEDARAPVEVYRSYLKEGRLGFQRCRGCRSAIFYPRVLCPVCGSTSLAWETSGGRGTVIHDDRRVSPCPRSPQRRPS